MHITHPSSYMYISIPPYEDGYPIHGPKIPPKVKANAPTP